MQVSVPGQAVDVDDGPGAHRAEADLAERGVEVGQIRLADPAEDDVLLHRAAHVVTGEAPGQIGEGAHLVAGQVAERQGHGGHRVALLALRAHVGRPPGVEALRARPAPELDRRAQRLLLLAIDAGQPRRPARVLGQAGALREHHALELLDAQLGDVELEAGAGRFFFSPMRAKTREMAWEMGKSSRSGRNSSKSLASCGTAPRPPRITVSAR